MSNRNGRILFGVVGIALMSISSIASAQAPQQDIRRTVPLPEEAHLFQYSRQIPVITMQARMSLQHQQAALQVLSQAATPDYIRDAHYKAVFAYRLIRAAHENLLSRQLAQKFPDPLLQMAEKAIKDSRYTVVLVDGLLDDGHTRDPNRVAAAIEKLNAAIIQLENALALMP